eukprot:s1371_g12.t1
MVPFWSLSSRAQQSKFDLGKDSICHLCGQPDSLDHRCTQCPARRSIYAQHPIVQRWPQISISKRLRLLPPLNPYWEDFKVQMNRMPDRSYRLPALGDGQECHLFTDGSSHGASQRMFQLSAWAVVNANTDSCIARGTLGGLGQSNDRAELRAVIAAIEYSIESGIHSTIWTDSTYVAEGTVRLLRDISDVPSGHYEEDWIELQGLLWHSEIDIKIQHIPGHAKWQNMDYDVANWAARWNDRADREANMAIRLHGADLCALHARLCEHHERELRELRALQDLHLAVLAHKGEDLEEEDADPGPCGNGDEEALDTIEARGVFS